jgi:hypothetical protein
MDRTRLTQAVDQVPDLKGAGIAYIGEQQCTVIRESDHMSGFRTYVVFQEIDGVAFSVAPSASTNVTTKDTQPNPAQISSTVGAELKSAALNCGGVVVSALVAGSSAVAIPVSAGFSSVPLAIASSAFVATSLRCGLSVGRLINATHDSQLNRVIDNSEWYPVVSTVIEAIDVVDATHSGLKTIAKYRALRKATSKSMLELIKGAPREDRKRIAEEMAKFTGDATSRRSFLRLARQGKLPKLYEVKEIRKEILKGLLEAAQSGKTIADSLSPGGQGNKRGVVNELVVHIMQEN